MAGPHENMEHAEHAQHASHTNKRVALMIAIIALFLAFSETLGKSAQTAGVGYNVEAANLRAFFQAKAIRRTLVETAAEAMKVAIGSRADAAAKPATSKQNGAWHKPA